MKVGDRTMGNRRMREFSLMPNQNVTEISMKPQAGGLAVHSRGPSVSVLQTLQEGGRGLRLGVHAEV
jgi:hypothetical protein